MLNKNEIKSKFNTEEDIKSFEDSLNAAQADKLYKDGMISEPALVGLADDLGIPEALYISRTENQQIRAIRNANPDVFLSIMAAQFFGAGMLTQFKIKEKNAPLSELVTEELADFIKSLTKNDPYFMACSMLDAAPGSDDKKYLDSVTKNAITAAKDILGEKIFEDDFLKVLCSVLYDTGITLASI